MKIYTFNIDKTKHAVICNDSYRIATKHGLSDALDHLNTALFDYSLVAKDPIQQFDGSYNVTLNRIECV